MKAVKVQYTVAASFAEQNKENIVKVMEALRADPIDGMLYSSYTLDDSRTFVHINIARDAETLSQLSGVQEFRDFQSALRASEPEVPPEATDLHLVGAGFTL
jgi:hypothetical protein